MKTSTGAVIVVLVAVAAAANTGGIDTTPPSAPPAVVDAPVDEPADVPEAPAVDEPERGDAFWSPQRYDYLECDPATGLLVEVRPDTPEGRADGQADCDAVNGHFDDAGVRVDRATG